MSREFSCECVDMGGNKTIYPYKGQAPHYKLDVVIPSSNGMLMYLPKKWQSNFVPDTPNSRYGTYTHCLTCDKRDED